MNQNSRGREKTMNPNIKVQEKKAVQVMTRLDQHLAVVCLVATIFLFSGCATKMAVAPKIQNAQTASDFRLYGHIQYDGNRDHLPRTLAESNDTNAPLILEYTYKVVYGRDKTPQAIPLFNPLTIVGFPIGENTLVVSTRLTVSKGKEALKEYISTCGMQGARNVFSEGDTFSEMRRKGLIATRDNIEQQLMQDREWLTSVSAPR
jgi:hypothetical protein